MRGLWRRLREPRGQIGAMMLAIIVGLFAITGLSVDVGLGFNTERRAQSAADAAARAGAELLPNANASTANAAAGSLAASNYSSTLAAQTSCPAKLSRPGTLVSGNCFYTLCSTGAGYDTISVVAQKSQSGIFSRIIFNGQKRGTASACAEKNRAIAPFAFGFGHACEGGEHDEDECFHGNPPVSGDFTFTVSDSIAGGGEEEGCGEEDDSRFSTGSSALTLEEEEGGRCFIVTDLNFIGGSSSPTWDTCLPGPPQDSCWNSLNPMLQGASVTVALGNKLPRVPTRVTSGEEDRKHYTRLNFALTNPNGVIVPIASASGGGCRGGGSGSSTTLSGGECPAVVGFGLFRLTSYTCVDPSNGRTAGCSGSYPNVRTITGHWQQLTEKDPPSCAPGETTCAFYGLKVISLIG